MASEHSPNAEKILQVAIRLLAKKGYNGTSTREICEAAGVTKPMIYYYFGNKEGLCKAAIRRFSEQFFTILREMVGRASEPRQSMIDFIWTQFEFMRDNRDVVFLCMNLYSGPDRQQFAEDLEAIGREIHGLTARFVEKIAATGFLRPGCEEHFSVTLHGMIEAWDRASVVDGVELSRELAEQIVDNLLNGFAAR